MQMEKFLSLQSTVHSCCMSLSERVTVNRKVPSRHTPAVTDIQVAFNEVCGKLATSPVTRSVAALSYVNIGLKSAVRCHCNMMIDLPKLIITPPESGRSPTLPAHTVRTSKICYSNSDNQGNKTCGPFYPLLPKSFILASAQQLLSQRETCGRKKLREEIVLNKSPMLQSLKRQ